jgi:hypothetical protein
MPIALELPPDFDSTIYLMILLPDARNFTAQLLVTNGTLAT